MCRMKRILLFGIIALSVFFWSCKDNEIGFIKTSTYVQGYWPLEGISAYVTPQKTIWLYEYVKDNSGVISPASNGERFAELSEKHSDRDFSGNLLEDNLPKNFFFAHDFSSISITSDADYDEAHPAGNSLADIARFITVTPAKYVASRYTETFDWDQYEHQEMFEGYFANAVMKNGSTEYQPGHQTFGRDKVFPVYKMVNALSTQDMTLLGLGDVRSDWRIDPLLSNPFAVIEFTVPPTLETTHTITIVFTTDEGTKIEAKQVTIAF